MMWAEAMLSATLVLFALFLALSHPAEISSLQFLRFYQAQQLSDEASLAIQSGSTGNLCKSLTGSFCYKCTIQSISTPAPKKTAYSSVSCAQKFKTAKNILSITKTYYEKNQIKKLEISKFAN